MVLAYMLSIVYTFIRFLLSEFHLLTFYLLEERV